jgi:hypothetical protein
MDLDALDNQNVAQDSQAESTASTQVPLTNPQTAKRICPVDHPAAGDPSSVPGSSSGLGDAVGSVRSKEEPQAGRKKTRTAKNNDDGRTSAAKKAMELANDLQMFLFHTPDGDPFASVPIDQHRETFSLVDSGFEKFFTANYYKRERSILRKKDFADVQSAVIGRAQFDGPEMQVYVRLAKHEDDIYLDLANERWEVVKISGEGWKIIKVSPVIFRRPKGMKPLPPPTGGGSIELLRPYVNVGNDDNWKLLVSFLVAALRPTGPYPILALQGNQGSAKSTTSEVLRRLIDPSTAALRSAPHDQRDLMISATNGWIPTFENLSSVPPWFSDALCRLSTGSGFSTRQLYTDSNEKILAAARPIILNGIHIGIENGDLFDRSLVMTAPPILDEARMTEADFWPRFEQDQPAILGALLDAVVVALRRLREVDLPGLPRMADFAKWVTAAEPAFGWPEGSFLEAYRRNRQEAHESALESSPLTKHLENLVSDKEPWEGTATVLLEALNEIAGERATRQRNWPHVANDLSGKLKRLAPNLEAIGIQVEFSQTAGKNSKKIIRITRRPTDR